MVKKKNNEVRISKFSQNFIEELKSILIETDFNIKLINSHFDDENYQILLSSEMRKKSMIINNFGKSINRLDEDDVFYEIKNVIEFDFLNLQIDSNDIELHKVNVCKIVRSFFLENEATLRLVLSECGFVENTN